MVLINHFKSFSIYRIVLFLICLQNAGCKAQKQFGNDNLALQKVILLKDVKGRIDHLFVDIEHNILYIAALGNNSVEVIDLTTGENIHSIKGLDEPQGVLYIPNSNLIFIANGGNGLCQFLNTDTYLPASEINLSDDADNVKYDPEEQTIYAGYGNAGIAVINAKTQKLIGTIKLDGHPESFQIDSHSKKIWANVPKDNVIEVIDGKTFKVIDKWKYDNLSSNFPMSYDSIHHRLFVGFRSQSKLLILNSETGEKITVLDCVSDADDIFYDENSKWLIVSGGGGYIDIIEQKDSDTYTAVSHILTRKGARTSCWVPEWKELLLAVPENSGQSAELRIYKSTN